MSNPAAPEPCPFAARLVALLLSDEPARLGRNRTRLFSHLIALEEEARLHDASRKTRLVIAQVRAMAGPAQIIPFPLRASRPHR